MRALVGSARPEVRRQGSEPSIPHRCLGSVQVGCRSVFPTSWRRDTTWERRLRRLPSKRRHRALHDHFVASKRPAAPTTHALTSARAALGITRARGFHPVSGLHLPRSGGDGAMCLFVGVMAETRATFSYCLRDAQESLARQSGQHPDGWGVAGFRSTSWRVHRGVNPAGLDPQFGRAVSESADVLVAHVRKRTIGTVSAANTHPFIREGWAFAHNGTIEDCSYFRRHASTSRLREVVGDTDSEMLFAYLLTAIDRHGHAGIQPALLRLREAGVRGSLNFVLSDGAAMFAYRSGRPLFLLHRKAHRSWRCAGRVVPVYCGGLALGAGRGAALRQTRRPCVGRMDPSTGTVATGASVHRLRRAWHDTLKGRRRRRARRSVHAEPFKDGPIPLNVPPPSCSWLSGAVVGQLVGMYIQFGSRPTN